MEQLRNGARPPLPHCPLSIVHCRSLFCYWAAHDLKISLSDPARKLGMTAAGVGYAARRGEAISIGGNYQLID